jgi:hypothetical protein
MEIGIGKWFRLFFEGKNRDKVGSNHGITITYSQTLGDVIGRDKNIFITKEINGERTVSPQLKIKLINENNEYIDEMSFIQQGENQPFYFGLSLHNLANGSRPAREIEIRIVCSWNGNNPISAPKIRPGNQLFRNSEWRSERQLIQEGKSPLPAILVFHGSSNTRSIYSHPLEWKGFEVVLSCWMKGSIILDYQVSSANPITNSNGRLSIVFSNDK